MITIFLTHIFLKIKYNSQKGSQKGTIITSERWNSFLFGIFLSGASGSLLEAC